MFPIVCVDCRPTFCFCGWPPSDLVQPNSSNYTLGKPFSFGCFIKFRCIVFIKFPILILGFGLKDPTGIPCHTYTFRKGPGKFSPWNSPGQNTGVGKLFPSPAESSPPRDQSWVSCIAGGFFTSSATRKVLENLVGLLN